MQKRTIVEGKEAGERELKKKTGEKVGYHLKGQLRGNKTDLPQVKEAIFSPQGDYSSRT